MRSLNNVRVGLADTIRALEAGRLESGMGRTLIYGLSQLANVVMGSEIEQRIRALEERRHS